MLYADLIWEELSYIINKSSDISLSDDKLKKSSYQERCNLLNKTVLVVKHFQYRVAVFFEEIIPDGQLEKTKHYTRRLEFHERVSPHDHFFKWIYNNSNIQNETVNIVFIEKIFSCQKHLKDKKQPPEVFYQKRCS